MDYDSRVVGAIERKLAEMTLVSEKRGEKIVSPVKDFVESGWTEFCTAWEMFGISMFRQPQYNHKKREFYEVFTSEFANVLEDYKKRGMILAVRANDEQSETLYG